MQCTFNQTLSVIIINHNNFNLLDNCLKSFHQFIEEVDYEVIVVDNASSEGDVTDVIFQYPHVKLIKNKENLGFSAANNLAVESSLGHHLLFLNNDIVFRENTIKLSLDFLRQQKNPSIVGVRLLNEDLSMQESCFEFTTLWNSFTENFFLYKLFPKSKFFNKYWQNYSIEDHATEVDVIKGAYILCSRETFERLNGFDDRFFFYAEEADLCYRLKQLGGKVFYLSFLPLIHLGGQSTGEHTWFKYKNQTTAKIQILQKHFSGWKFLVGLMLHWIGLSMRAFLYLIRGLLTLRKIQFVKSKYFFLQIFIYPKNKFKS